MSASSRLTRPVIAATAAAVVVGLVLSLALLAPRATPPATAAPLAEPDAPAVGGPRFIPDWPLADAEGDGGGEAGDFISYVRPDDALVYQIAAERAGPGASPAQVEAAAADFRADWNADHYHGPHPAAHQQALQREQALLDGTPRSQLAAVGAPAIEGNLRLLAIAVEFDGEDFVENFAHEDGIRTGICITETVTYKGPLHNEIAHPGPLDNNTFWMPSFEKDFFEKIILSTEGITERVRMDLIDPLDGQPGIDISGLSMANFFHEVASGMITFDAGPAGIQAWVKVPHSVAYYGANACRNGQVSGSGLPTNPRFPSGMSQLIADIAASINAADPDFPWADYDTDGNGIIDHVQLFHAGIDESEGGGIHDQQQIWAHRGSADGQRGGVVVDDRGTADPADDVRILGYTIQPENLNLGVLVHEFGHDLGLGDLYTTTGTENAVWWDLMSTGSHPGRLKGSDPTHMSAWSKLALGWLEPEVVVPIDDPQDFVLGQAALPPAGTTRAIRVDLEPSKVPILSLPDSSKLAWYSGNQQAWASHRLSRDLDLRAVTGASYATYDVNYVLQANRDFYFLEASADGGQTWVQLKGYRVDTGAELTTADDYADPNGLLATYGNRKYGFNGNSQQWRRVRHDLSAFAGQQVKLQFHYATDASNQSRGVFLDNIAIRAGDQTLLDDPVEGGDAHGWSSERGTFNGAALNDAGWRLTDAIQLLDRYYLLEWRNAVSNDRGLQWTYNTVLSRVNADGQREFRVDKVPSNVPGLTIWLRDLRYGTSRPSNGILTPGNITAAESEGAKGGLLLVDAHPEPYRGDLGAVVQNEFGRFPYPPENNWSGRVQTTNSAFGLLPTSPISLTAASKVAVSETPVLTTTGYAALPAVPAFHDALGHQPGVETLPVPITVLSDGQRQRIKAYAFTDADASVVIPASSYYPPRTPAGFTGLGAETSPPSADIGTDETMYLRGTTPTYVDIGAVAEEAVTGRHSGHPGDRRVHFGFHFQVIGQAPDGTTGTVRLWRQADAAEVTANMVGAGGEVRVNARMRNVGGAGSLVLYSDFDAAAATLVAGSTKEGATPVSATAEEVVAAVQSGGAAALAALAVPPAEATAVAWAGRVPTGTEAALAYALSPSGQATILLADHAAYAVESDAGRLDRRITELRLGARLFLPRADSGR